MDKIKTQSLLNLNETIAKAFLEENQYPWETICKIKDFIIKIGENLSNDVFEQKGENIWIAKNAKISPTACITGPVIIDEEAEIRHCAYIRGNVIVGKNAVVGNSTELKNCILFNSVQVPHFNYVGDSILGYKAHLGAGVIISNLRSDKKEVKIIYSGKIIDTNLRKFGAILGDFTEIGCNSVLNPGTILGKNVLLYPLSCVKGVIPENSIYIDKENIVIKRMN